MNIEDMTPEQKEKACACKTTEELVALFKKEGIELSDGELAEITGGMKWACEKDDWC